MPIIFALIAFAGWGVGDIFGTLVTRKIGNIYSFFWLNIFGLIFGLPFIPFAGPIVSYPYLMLAFFLGLIDSLGSLFYFRGLEVGNASLVGTISGSFSVITILLSMGLFGEKVTLIQLSGIILVLIGIVLTSLKFEETHGKTLKNFFSDRGIIYALIAMIFWGIYFALVRIPAEKIGWFWSYYPASFNALLFLPFGLIKSDIFKIFRRPALLINTLLFSLLLLLAMFSFNLGILRGYTSIVAPIAGAYPVLFVILTRIFFKEKLTIQQKIGLGLGLLGIVVISFSSISTPLG